MEVTFLLNLPRLQRLEIYRTTKVRAAQHRVLSEDEDEDEDEPETS